MSQRNRCGFFFNLCDTHTKLLPAGSIIFSALPGATPLKPGSTTFPFFGIKPVLMSEETKVPLEGLCLIEQTNSSNKHIGNGVKGLLVIAEPWPSMARTIFNDHARYLK